ncbi:PhoD-like phosphatase-domain-containing protein [Neurospora hispaniola]|uniref:PhoD-like phosphatase-domain-containing protein n=1 Tax=Neurospora hispaniola TaxID=588809 RepID=A0AAJ0I110_9PEZI|nr:PhoD-like phosphatase-domain-containing protein [Neurospora hispaniola]
MALSTTFEMPLIRYQCRQFYLHAISQTMKTGFLLFAAGASAFYAGNINYFSPSLRHPSLGISIPKVAARTYESLPWKPEQLNFTHGVASGDPYDDSVILWTRAAPTMDNDHSNTTVSETTGLFSHETEEFVFFSKSKVCVDWKIATDEKFEKVADEGRVWTSSDIDFTVKVEAKRLFPFTTYYYQFNICDSYNNSPVGRTKTLPAKGNKVPSDIKLAVYSCSNYPQGFFNMFGNTVRKDSVDFIVFLGDYIYEFQNGQYGWGDALGRIPQPDRVTYTLYDYRRRIATYRTDLDLVANHMKFPWIQVWDDHEVADNTWRDGSSFLQNNEDSFISDGGVSTDSRKANAVRAYFEWMPIRQVDMDDGLRIWRNFEFGDLFDLIMLDTRQYDRSITNIYTNTGYIKDISNDTSRSLMGPRQEAWFYRTLKESSKRGTKWRLIGNQIIFSQLIVSKDMNLPYDYDAWDGYVANRNRTFATLYENSITNNIMLAGDSHASWASDLVWLDKPIELGEYDPITGRGAIGVEFAVSAVSSPSPLGQNVTMEETETDTTLLTGFNKELQWTDLYYRGYTELCIGYEGVTARFYGSPDIRTRNGFEVSLANFTVKDGENRLQRYGEEMVASVDGKVEFGSLQRGKTVTTNLTYDTEEKRWFVFGEQ